MIRHRDIELAGYLAECGGEILNQCRGIPVAALRQYLKACKSQCEDWLAKLDPPALIGADLGDAVEPPGWTETRRVIEDIARSGILVRVASTLLHAIGDRMDIPLAIDVANQSARAYAVVVQRAIAIVSVRTDCPATHLTALDQMGRVADRLSDLLCGALLPAGRCDRFVVDPHRARDFAGTYGKNPRLVRVPVQRVAVGWAGTGPISDCAPAVERALLGCLPRINRENVGRGDSQKGGSERLLRVVNLEGPVQETSGAGRPLPLSFPKHSFAQSRKRLTGSTFA